MKRWAVYSTIIIGFCPVALTAQPVDNSIQARQISWYEAGTRINSADGGALTELAGAYWRAGRLTDAVAAYRRVLALDNVMLETRAGDDVWSHENARQALVRTIEMTPTRP